MRKWSRAAALIVGLGFCTLASETAPVADMPKLTLTDFPPEVRTQVQQAYESAREHPGDAEFSGKLGMLLELYHRPHEASVCYQRAHRLDPMSFKWLYYLGSLLAKQGKHREAVKTLRAASRLKPDYLPARLKLGESLFASGELDQSSEIYS